MFGITLEFSDAERLRINIGQQAAGRLAVKTRGGNQHGVLFDALRPGAGVQLNPIVPALLGRKRCEVVATWARIKRLPSCLRILASGRYAFIGSLNTHGHIP